MSNSSEVAWIKQTNIHKLMYRGRKRQKTKDRDSNKQKLLG